MYRLILRLNKQLFSVLRNNPQANTSPSIFSMIQANFVHKLALITRLAYQDIPTIFPKIRVHIFSILHEFRNSYNTCNTSSSETRKQKQY